MLGKLNASHMGLNGKDREKIQSEWTGFLGIDILPRKKDLIIKHVIPDSPADKIASKLNTGDIILSVIGSQREVIIRPAGRLSAELYDEQLQKACEVLLEQLGE